jgi:hypothetical protein
MDKMEPGQEDSADLFSRWSQLIWSIVTGIATIASCIVTLSPGGTPLSLTMHQRFCLVLELGLMMSVFHAILWSIAEKVSHWRFGAGGKGILPRGAQAVVLSTTVTVPLLVLPPVYERFTGTVLISADHYFWGWPVSAVGCALGHLLIYGTRRPYWRGLRAAIEARTSRVFLLETIILFLYSYAVVDSVVLAYRLATARPGSLVMAGLASPLVVFFGGLTFKIARYPESISDPAWREVRGVLVGFFVMLSIAGGCFL